MSMNLSTKEKGYVALFFGGLLFSVLLLSSVSQATAEGRSMLDRRNGMSRAIYDKVCIENVRYIIVRTDGGVAIAQVMKPSGSGASVPVECK